MGKTRKTMTKIKTTVLLLALMMLAASAGWGQDRTEAVFREGVRLYLQGNLVAARGQLEQVLADDPTNANALRLMEDIKAELGSSSAPASAMPASPYAGTPYSVTTTTNPNLVPLAPGSYSPGEGLVNFSPLPVDNATAVAVPPQRLAGVLQDRLELRGTPTDAVPGVNSLTGIEVSAAGADMKIRLFATGDIDYLETKVYQPPMLIVDLMGCKDDLPRRALPVGAGSLVRIRHSQERTEPMYATRVILDLAAVPPYIIERVPGGVVVTIPNAGAAAGTGHSLGEPPSFHPWQTSLTPLTAYQVQSQWLRIVGGERQMGRAGDPQANPMVVQVTGADGTPQAGVGVTFAVTEGNGYFETAQSEKTESITVLTDANGHATVDKYHFSTTVGDNVVTAAIGEMQEGGVYFIHTSVPGEARDLVKVHGDDQEGLVDSELEEPLVVEVRDRFANPVSGQRVVFTVLYNDGVADADPERWGVQSVVVSDEHGRARLDNFQLGSRVGLNRVKASIIVEDVLDYPHGAIMIAAEMDRTQQRGDNNTVQRSQLWEAGEVTHGNQTGESGEIWRHRVVNEEGPVIADELLRSLPFTQDEYDLQIIHVPNASLQQLRYYLKREENSSARLRFFDEFNAVYVEDSPDDLRDWLAALQEEIPGIEVVRKAVRSVVFAETGKPQLISVDFRDASVVDVIRTLAEVANWNVVFPASGDMIYDQQITIHLLEVPARTVLDNILEQTGYARVESAGIIRIVPLQELPGRETRIGAGIDLDRWEGQEDEYITYVIPVSFRIPSDLVGVLSSFISTNGMIQPDDPSNQIVVTDRVANIRRLVEMVKVLDSEAAEAISGNLFVKVINLQRAKAADMVNLLTSLQPVLQPAGVSGAVEFLAAQLGTEEDKLLLVCSQASAEQLQEIIAELDSGRNEIMVFSLNRMSPADLALVLQDLYPNVTTWSPTSGNALIAMVPSTLRDELQAVVDTIDSSMTEAFDENMQRGVIRLQRLDPLKAEQILQQAFPNAQVFALGRQFTYQREYVDENGDKQQEAVQEYIGLYGVLAIADQRDIDLMRETVQAMDLSPFPEDFAMTTYRPRFQSVTTLRDWASLLIGEDRQGKIILDDFTNRLMIWDNAENTQILLDFFAKMDSSPTEGFATRTFSIGNMLASKMATILGSLYQGVFLEIEDDEKNLVFVKVPIDVIDQVAATIRDLDNMEMTGELVKVFPLSANIVPADLESDLLEIFPNYKFMSTEWPVPAIIASGAASGMDKIGDLVSELDQPIITRTFRITYGDAKNIQTLLTQYVTTQGQVQADGRTNSVVVRDVTSNMDKLQRIIRELDVDLSTQGEGSTKVFYLKNADASELVSVLSNVVQPERGENEIDVLIGTLSADARTNSILVNSTPQHLPRIAQLIELLDVQTPQVLIEATILEYTLNEDDDLGVVWNFADRFGDFNYSTVFNGGVSGPFSFTLSKGQLSVVIDALQSTDRSEILSAPRVMTLNNKEANIVVGTTRQQLQYNYDDQGNLTSTTYSDKTADLDLKVTPQIGIDRSVKLDFELDLEQFLPVTSGSNELPTNNRRLTNSVIVADEQTLVIGGIIRDEKAVSNSGIPFLRDIPGLGRIFASNSEKKQKVELMIFLTPRVVANPAEGTQVTQFTANQLNVLTPLPVNINTASFDEIIKLPGLRSADDPRRSGILASRIIRHREMYGPYQSLEELKFVPGIDDKVFEDIVYRLKYRIEVNTISLEELRAIKGIQLPMAQGFVNYRKEHGLFTDYATVKRVFVQLGLPSETYDAFLSDIIYIGNVYRGEQEVEEAPRGPAGIAPPPVVTPDIVPAPPVDLPVPDIRTDERPPSIDVAPSVTPSPGASDLVNLNTAEIDDLRDVGFDDLGARLVIAYRNRYGDFSSVTELKSVPGINQQMYDRVKDQVTVGASHTDSNNGILLMPSLPVDEPAETGSYSVPGPATAINLNEATVSDLALLPGLDDYKARMIVAYRYTYGDFTAVEQLLSVPSLTEDDFRAVREYIRVP